LRQWLLFSKILSKDTSSVRIRSLRV